MTQETAKGRWPLGWQGAEVVFFDCDSTLSAIEGVDELAKRRGADVGELTRAAMAGEIPIDQVYRKRLEAIHPGPADFAWLAERYRQAEVPGAAEVVGALQALGIACHLISGGLLPGVAAFARHLGFPAAHVHAVPYGGADPISTACAHPLAREGGKPAIIAQVCAAGPPLSARLMVGDGASDLEARSAVGLFLGFGGVVVRERVRRESPVFLCSPDLYAVAAVAAGPRRLSDLERIAPRVYHFALQNVAHPAHFTIQPT